MSTTVGPAGNTRFSSAQMRSPVDNVVHRPVPPVHRAVVQAQFGELRDASGGQLGDRILVGHLGQQGREVADVLLEQVEDRA